MVGHLTDNDRCGIIPHFPNKPDFAGKTLRLPFMVTVKEDNDRPVSEVASDVMALRHRQRPAE